MQVTNKPIPAPVAYIPPPHITDVKDLPTFHWADEVMALCTDDDRGDLISNLVQILEVQRNHGSIGEAKVFTMLIHEFSDRNMMVDGAGNLHVDMRWGIDTRRTLFTSHTDTCHTNSGKESNPVYMDITDGKVMLHAGKGHCLGADDGAGVALMWSMINANVGGYYIFFRGEEKGGVGSSWLAKNMPDLLKQFDRAVAFDRAGYSDVITHQSRGRCCSDEFANALAVALTTEDFSLAYAADDTGVYTDTAEFISIIPECTNLSVGYKNQHGDREQQDLTFLCQLFDRLLTVKWDDLPTKRDPKVREISRFGGFYNYGRMSSKDLSWWDEPLFDKRTVEHVEARDDEQTLDAELLLDALDKAAETGNHIDLRWVIAELVHPDDPQMALNNMTKRLRSEDIDDAYDDLTCGADATTTAEYLYTCCSNV